MSKAVVSGFGPDRPGIVAAISGILASNGCNIEDSTMTRLAREFTVILIISVPDGVPLEELQRRFAALETSHGLTMMLKAIPDDLALDSHVPENPYMIQVGGHDHTGITFRVAQRLAELGINITDLNAQVITGDDGPVYIMMVEVDIPLATDMDALRGNLRALGRELAVEIQLRPLEALAL